MHQFPLEPRDPSTPLRIAQDDTQNNSNRGCASCRSARSPIALLGTMMTETERPSDFIRDIIAEDLRSGKYEKIITRFPPEPNGYLHIGHAKSICLNFGIAHEFGGLCNIRMDDTNPTKEEAEYVESIMTDVHWLIDDWAEKQLGGAPFYASDYFDRFYEYAVELIRKGKAYVDDMSPEETDAYRRLGKASSFRDRSVDENLDLFARMKAGEFANGARTLRAKIDVNAANVWLRDPVLYRIRHASHHRTGDKWCIYPMYDWAHTLSDYIEGITHSICTLEFEVHRPLYDWILDALEVPEPRPHQYEFARLNLTYTVMSKRKLIQLVNEKLVNGWDDPQDADHFRFAPARRDADGIARPCVQYRDHQIPEYDRYGVARTRHARRTESHRDASPDRAATNQSCADKLPGK